MLWARWWPEPELARDRSGSGRMEMHGVGLRAAQDVEFGGWPCRRATRKLPPSVAEPNATRVLCDGAMRAACRPVASSFCDECPANDVVATLLRLPCGFDSTTDLVSVARLLVVKLVFIVVYNLTRCPVAASASAQCSQRPAGPTKCRPVLASGRAWLGLDFKSLMGHLGVGRYRGSRSLTRARHRPVSAA